MFHATCVGKNRICILYTPYTIVCTVVFLRIISYYIVNTYTDMYGSGQLYMCPLVRMCKCTLLATHANLVVTTCTCRAAAAAAPRTGLRACVCSVRWSCWRETTGATEVWLSWQQPHISTGTQHGKFCVLKRVGQNHTFMRTYGVHTII